MGSKIKMLGERVDSDEAIFRDLKYHTWMNKELQNWVDDAGIKRK